MRFVRLLAAAAVLVALGQPMTAAAAGPVHDIQVSGTGVGMFPDFAEGITRYAVTTTDATGGSLTVAATTSDPAGKVRVNGRRAGGSGATVNGLEPGDEVSVLITDSGGTTGYSLIYLPSGYPELEVIADQPGHSEDPVWMTLTLWSTGDDFETVVDRNGVPIHVDKGQSQDLKVQPNGNYSVQRGAPGPSSDGVLVELDQTFTPVAEHTNVGLDHLDGHDSILLPNGNRVQLAYEPSDTEHTIDSIIQEITPADEVVFEWSSAPIYDETVQPVPADPTRRHDYAHINSIVITADGHFLASFRNLSAVLKIARFDDGAFQEGDIIWRLGGRASDFTFLNDPHAGGPCAQHTASELSNGNILIYDNGSGGTFAPICIDPNDPEGDTIARTNTRVTEYELDLDAVGGPTATLVDSWESGRSAGFAGSSQRLANGNTMVGWAVGPASTATEVTEDDQIVWELRAPNTTPGQPATYQTYRALAFPAPDVIDPTIWLGAPAADATFEYGEVVKAKFGCTDRGGSTLQACDGSVMPGRPIDTSTPGTHSFTVEAEDGAGNVTTISREYTVGPPPARTDAAIRSMPDGDWVGRDVYGPADDQTVRQQISEPQAAVSARIAMRNDGPEASRIRIVGPGSTPAFRVSYLAGDQDVTQQVTEGTLKTPLLDAGESYTFTVRVQRRLSAEPGDRRVVGVRGITVLEPTQRDAVATIVRATR